MKQQSGKLLRKPSGGEAGTVPRRGERSRGMSGFSSLGKIRVLTIQLV